MIFETLLAFGAALIFIILPGLPLVLALRIRGSLFWPFAVAASFAVTALATLLTGTFGSKVGLPGWGPLWPFLLALVLAPVLFLLSFAFNRRNSVVSGSGSESPKSKWIEALLPITSVVVAFPLIAIVFVSALPAADAISQSYDAIFHLNASRLILETGNASPLEMSLVTASPTFYPTLWHAIVANISLVTGASIALSTNVLTVAVSAVVWPLGAAVLTAILFGKRLHIFLGAGVAATGFVAFPFLLARWGVVYPNLLATALIPFLVAAIMLLLSRRLRKEFSLHIFGAVTFFLGSLGAATLAHPNAFFATWVITLPFQVLALSRFLKARPGMLARILSVLAIAATTALMLFLWMIIETGDNTRTFYNSLPKATAAILLNAPFIGAQAWFATVLVLAGMTLSVYLKVSRWWIVSWVLAAGLFIVAAGLPKGNLRTAITGLWYNDAHRLAAVVAIVAVPFAAFAAAWLLKTVFDSVQSKKVFVPLSFGILTLALLLTGMKSATISNFTDGLRYLHAFEEEERILDPAEILFFEEIDGYLSDDDLLVGNPWNGSTLVYAFTGHETLFPHLAGSYSADMRVVGAELKDGTPEACDAARALGVTHVLDFGTDYYYDSKKVALYEGVTDVSKSGVLTPVHTRGDIGLYEITGCDF